jgi:hypothetical protein
MKIVTPALRQAANVLLSELEDRARHDARIDLDFWQTPVYLREPHKRELGNERDGA